METEFNIRGIQTFVKEKKCFNKCGSKYEQPEWKQGDMKINSKKI